MLIVAAISTCKESKMNGTLQINYTLYNQKNQILNIFPLPPPNKLNNDANKRFKFDFIGGQDGI